MAWLHLLCPSTLLQHNKTNILAGFVEYNSKREIIFSIFLTLEVKSYLILINFWKIVRILMISEKSDLGTHSGKPSHNHSHKGRTCAMGWRDLDPNSGLVQSGELVVIWLYPDYISTWSRLFFMVSGLESDSVSINYSIYL